MSNELLNKAIIFATKCHAGQVRKGTSRAYITHPLETMSILNFMQADESLLAAGVLHDTIEDTDATYEQLIDLFGYDIAELVGKHSEDKSKSWKERKSNAIKELKEAPLSVKLLVMADKVANLRSMYVDYQIVGEKLWERFNAPKKLQAWYYSGIQDALVDLQHIPEAKEVYWEMVGRFKDLFVDYYIDVKNDILYQICADDTGCMLKKETCEWTPVDEEIGKVVRLERYRAEFIEDMWNEMIERDYN